jgi:hypothetical protein
VNKTYFSGSDADTRESDLIQSIVGQLASFCACLGENPSIRYR